MQNSVKWLVHFCEHTALPTAALHRDPILTLKIQLRTVFFLPLGVHSGSPHYIKKQRSKEDIPHRRTKWFSILLSKLQVIKVQSMICSTRQYFALVTRQHHQKIHGQYIQMFFCYSKFEYQKSSSNWKNWYLSITLSLQEVTLVVGLYDALIYFAFICVKHFLF